MSKENKADPVAEAQAAANAEANKEATPTPAAEPAKPKAEKAPLPEGWITPVSFAKKLSEKLGREVRPQVVYGYVRNSKQFPSKQNTDGAWIVDEAAAFKWWDEKEARKAETAAKKAEKEAKAAEKAKATEAEPAKG